MWFVTREKETGIGNFLTKRIIRIVPLYWSVTTLVTVGAVLKPNLFPIDDPQIYHVVKSLLFIPHHMPNGNENPIVGQGWTLNFEMFFYAIFSITMAFSRSYQLNLLSLFLMSFVLLGVFVPSQNDFFKEFTSPLLLEFLAGAIICRCWRSNKLLNLKLGYLAIGVGVSGVVVFYVSGFTEPRFLARGIPAILVVSGFLSVERVRGVPYIKPLKTLGDASYSIYLTHYLSWLVLSLAIQKFGGHINNYVYIPTVLFATIMGVCTYYVFEKPVTKYLSGIFSSSDKTGLLRQGSSS